MAIKGKRRTRGGRTTAGAPRPVLVTPKTPLVQRRGFKITLLVVLLGIVALVAWLFFAEARANREQERVQGQVREFEVLVQSALTDTQAAVSGVGQALTGFEQGEFNPRPARRDAADWEESLTAAAQAVGGIETEGAEMREARYLIQQGMRLYATVAALVGTAAGAEGDTQESLLTRASSLRRQAEQMINRGVNMYRAVGAEAGIEQQPIPPQGGPPGAPGVPPGGPGMPGVPPGDLPPGVEIPVGG